MTSKNTRADCLRIAIYVRISKDDQGYALGVADQAKRCRELIAQRFPGAKITGLGCECADCREYGVPPDVYCDNDITASGKEERPHYGRLLAGIEAGSIDLVVSAHNDRLHRSPMELEGYINICQPREVPTHFVKAGDFDLTTASGRMVARMLGAMARAEWERMVERQLAAKRRTRDAGLRQAGCAPFGFHLDVRDARGQQIPGVSKGMAPDETEALAIRDGCEKVLAGATVYSVAAEWNARGLRTRAKNWAQRPGDKRHRGRQPDGQPREYSGLWSARSVQHVLTNPAIAGLITHEGKVTGNSAWAPIVDVDTWRAVTSVLSRPGRRTSPGPKPAHLLTGILICGVCEGQYFKCIRQSGGRGLAYVCAADSRTPGRSGAHTSRLAAKLDEYIEWIIIERLSDSRVVAALNTSPAVDIAALDRRRTAINAELEEWARAPGITPRQLQIKNGPLLDELAEVERQISEALRGDPLPEFTGNDPAKVWAGLKEAGSIDRMRAVARLLLRVRLQKGRGGVPKGWRPGMPVPLDLDAIEILWQNT